MSSIPLDLQRRFERRWAARFLRPNPPTAPQKHQLPTVAATIRSRHAGDIPNRLLWPDRVGQGSGKAPAAAKTSRADVVPATCSVPSTPRSIHPAFTASNISSAGPVWPFGMPNCSNASAHRVPKETHEQRRPVATGPRPGARAGCRTVLR
jgi:hypothetical protein